MATIRNMRAAPPMANSQRRPRRSIEREPFEIVLLVLKISSYGGQVAFPGTSMYHTIKRLRRICRQEAASFVIGMTTVEPQRRGDLSVRAPSRSDHFRAAARHRPERQEGVLRLPIVAAGLIVNSLAFAEPNLQTRQSIRDVVLCLKLAAQRLDDQRSDATSVADRIVGSCNSEINRSIAAGAQGMTFEQYETFRERTNAFWLKMATEAVLSERAAQGNSR